MIFIISIFDIPSVSFACLRPLKKRKERPALHAPHSSHTENMPISGQKRPSPSPQRKSRSKGDRVKGFLSVFIRWIASG
jgi:hypothetical protein